MKSREADVLYTVAWMFGCWIRDGRHRKGVFDSGLWLALTIMRKALPEIPRSVRMRIGNHIRCAIKQDYA